MSSGSSSIDPVELDDPRVPTNRVVEDRRRNTRRRRVGADFVRPTIDVMRRSAQEIYRRRRVSARQRSSGQQTETTTRPARVLVQGGHVTVLLRLLSRNPGQQELEMGTTIRMRIDLPDSPLSVISADAQSSTANVPRNTSPADLHPPQRQRRQSIAPRTQPQPQPERLRQSEPLVDPQLLLEPQTQLVPELQPQPQPQLERQAQLEPQPELEAAQAQLEPKPQPELELQPELERQTHLESRAPLATEPQLQLQAQVEPRALLEQQSQLQPQPMAQTQSQVEGQRDSEPQQQLEQQPPPPPSN